MPAKTKAGSAAAKKAWKTRKRRARERSGKRTPGKVLPHWGKATTKQERIVDFITSNLKNRIYNDLNEFRISSEADLRSAVTFHLRNFLDEIYNLPQTQKKGNWRLHTGLWAYPPEAFFKNRKKGKKSRVEIDVAITSIPEGFKGGSRLIGIELKEHQNVGEDAIKDLDKLIGLKKEKMLKYGFLIYLYRNDIESEDEDNRLSKKIPEKYQDRIFVITINAYEGMSSLDVKKFDKKWEQSKDLRPEKMTARKATEKRKRN